MSESLKGKRVKLVTAIQVEIEAVVEEEEDNGFVLRLDPSTAVPQLDGDEVGLRKYYAGAGIVNPEDPNLQWHGRAHRADLEVIE